MIVCKFGGTCTAYPTAIKNIKTLLEESKERKVFVFSAIGKENKQDTKMTDLLIEFADKENKEETKEKILEKFEKLLKTTGVKFNITRHLNKTFDEYLKIVVSWRIFYDFYHGKISKHKVCPCRENFVF